MNFGDAKTRATELINEYSNNGNIIINATQDIDYLLRFAALADDAQNEISDKIGIDTTTTINLSTATPTVTQNSYNKYPIPTDLKEHRYLRLDDERLDDYRIEDGYLILSQAYNSGVITWSYHKYPTVIMSLATGTTQDSYVFEVDAYTHYLIPYYMAGMVIADEKADISDKMLNTYYGKLGSMYKREITYPKRVREKVRW